MTQLMDWWHRHWQAFSLTFWHRRLYRAQLLTVVSLFVGSLLILTFAAPGTPTQAQNKLIPVRLQLKWFPQSQFAGYLVAKEKGYFKKEGLDVTLLPIGDQSPVQTVTIGGADFGTTWITDLLTARAQGLPVVHVAQLFQKSGYAMVSLKKSGIAKPENFKGKKIGIWPSGNEYPALALLRRLNLKTSLEAANKPDVELITYGFDPGLVFPGKVDVASAMLYNELNQIVGLGFPLEQLNVINLPDYGINLLEDLMFTTEKVLAEANFKGSGLSGQQVAAKLLKASLAGWNDAVKNQAEAVKIVLPACGATCKGSGSQADPVKHQTWQMQEIAKLYQAGPTLAGNAGLLDPKVFKANVDTLKSLGILKADPDPGVVTYSVWEAATGKKAPV